MKNNKQVVIVSGNRGMVLCALKSAEAVNGSVKLTLRAMSVSGDYASIVVDAKGKATSVSRRDYAASGRWAHAGAGAVWKVMTEREAIALCKVSARIKRDDKEETVKLTSASAQYALAWNGKRLEFIETKKLYSSDGGLRNKDTYVELVSAK